MDSARLGRDKYSTETIRTATPDFSCPEFLRDNAPNVRKRPELRTLFDRYPSFEFRILATEAIAQKSQGSEETLQLPFLPRATDERRHPNPLEAYDAKKPSYRLPRSA